MQNGNVAWALDGDTPPHEKEHGRFSKISFQWKLVLSFMLPFILLVSVTVLSMYSRVSRQMEDRLFEVTELSAMQINKSLDTYVDEMTRLSNLPLSDTRLSSILQNIERQTSYTQNYEDGVYILQSLFNILNYSPHLYSVTLVTNNDQMYREGSNRMIGGSGDLLKADWYRQLDENGTALSIIGPRIADEPYDTKSDTQVFTVARVIEDVYGNRLGVIILDGLYSDFSSLFAELESSDTMAIRLESSEGTVFYDSQLSFSDLGRPASVTESTLPEEELLEVTHESGNTGFKVLVTLSKAQLFSDVILQYQDLGILVLLLVLLSGVLYITISWYISRPLKELVSQIEQVEAGNLKVYNEVKGIREVREVSQELNRMVRRIDRLLDNLVMVETKQKEAEYRALQNQINPHFLYNTLETIRMHCVVNGEEEIAEAVEMLGTLLRMSISRDTYFTTLAEEVTHARCYLSIQNYRSKGRYDLEIDVPGPLMAYKIPKLVLQPLVENSINYGLEMKPGRGRVSIRAEAQGDVLQLMVEDDGLGMIEEEYEAVVDHLEAPEPAEGEHGIGLRNVHARIRLFFGAQYGVSISSHPNKGTKITLRLPLVANEKEIPYVPAHDRR